MKSLAPCLLAFAAGLSAMAPALAADDAFNRVVSAIPFTFDARGDGDPDKAVLVSVEGCSFDLYLYVADPVHGFKWTDGPVLVKKQFLDGGPYCAQGILEAGSKGALRVKVTNDWHPPMSSLTLTLVYRDKQFLVAGYESKVSSIIDASNADQPEHLTTCDLNYLTGKGRHNGKPVKLTPPAPKLADWTQDASETLCER